MAMRSTFFFIHLLYIYILLTYTKGRITLLVTKFNKFFYNTICKKLMFVRSTLLINIIFLKQKKYIYIFLTDYGTRDTLRDEFEQFLL